MCLPPMLLHPIKDVDMIIDDGEKPEDRMKEEEILQDK